MIRNLKVLGLALVAMLALGASAASAAEFHSESSSTTLSGGQSTTHEFTVEAGSTTCTTASFPGSQSGSTAASVTVSPSYSGCTNSLLGEMEVKMNGCQYTFHVGSTQIEHEGEANETHFWNGTVDITCPENAKIEVIRKSGGNPCTITVKPQSGIGGIRYENMGSGTGRTVTVIAGVTSLKYTQDGVFCPGNGFQSEKTFENGTYTGTTEESGKDAEGNATGIWVE